MFVVPHISLFPEKALRAHFRPYSFFNVLRGIPAKLRFQFGQGVWGPAGILESLMLFIRFAYAGGVAGDSTTTG